MRLPIKPLSVNKVWKGRRFKTGDYIIYELEMLSRLPDIKIPEGKLMVCIEFGFSNSGADIDNPVKPFLDILQKKYGFNDSAIYTLVVRKNIVKNGDEYIEFRIEKTAFRKLARHARLNQKAVSGEKQNKEDQTIKKVKQNKTVTEP